MNILIASFSFPWLKKNNFDGKFILAEAEAYAANGGVVKVVTPHFPGADKTEVLGERIKVFRFRYFFPESLQVLKRAGTPLYSQRSFLGILQIPLLCFFFAVHILKHSRWADVIHAEWTVAALLAFPAKWLFGKKIVVTARGSDIRLVPKWINRFIHHKVDAAIDCFGPQKWNDEYKKTYRAHYLKLPLVVHHDVSGLVPKDMANVISRKPEPFVILYIGRFDRMKIDTNQLPFFLLIHAGENLRQRGFHFHLFYIGDGEEALKKELLGLVRKHELHDYVTLLGPKTNVLDYVRFCHVGVGGIAFNGVSMDFTISGKPQILIDGEDNRDTPWQDGINAIMAKPNDEKDLTERLSWAMKNPGQLRKVGEQARQDMSEYIVDSVTGGRLYLRAFGHLLNWG
jgi:glycosyltransferase involved in cell wall biosynthesis